MPCTHRAVQPALAAHGHEEPAGHAEDAHHAPLHRGELQEAWGRGAGHSSSGDPGPPHRPGAPPRPERLRDPQFWVGAVGVKRPPEPSRRGRGLACLGSWRPCPVPDSRARWPPSVAPTWARVPGPRGCRWLSRARAPCPRAKALEFGCRSPSFRRRGGGARPPGCAKPCRRGPLRSQECLRPGARGTGPWVGPGSQRPRAGASLDVGCAWGGTAAARAPDPPAGPPHSLSPVSACTPPMRPSGSTWRWKPIPTLQYSRRSRLMPSR